jgi:hypothetical protein
VTIASAEMSSEGGMFQRRSSTRSWVDKSKRGSAGNVMPHRVSLCSQGADPPRNESGRARAGSNHGWKYKDVSAENGSRISNACIDMLVISECGILSKSILATQLTERHI